MFAWTADFVKLSLQLDNKDYQLGVSVRKWKKLCKSKVSNNKIVEAFQDNMVKEARAAGPIFCEPLNGNLVVFPETLQDFEEINTFKTTMLRNRGLTEMSITVNALSFSKTMERPYIQRSKREFQLM